MVVKLYISLWILVLHNGFEYHISLYIAGIYTQLFQYPNVFIIMVNLVLQCHDIYSIASYILNFK